MSVRIFLSHTKADKPFVRELAKDLDNHGIKCWLDEAEIKIVRSGAGAAAQAIRRRTLAQAERCCKCQACKW